MGEMPGEKKSIGTLDRLSQEIMDTLKELSMNRQPLSTSFLSKALAKRSSIVDLLRGRDPSAQSGPQGASEAEATAKELKGRVREMRHQRENMVRQLDDLAAQNSKLDSFCRRSLLSLAAQAHTPDNAPLFESLDRLKKCLMDEGPLTEIETILNEIKQTVFQGDVKKNGEPKPAQHAEPGFFDRLLGRKDAGVKADSSLGVYLKQMQGTYLNILLQFDLDFGAEYRERFSGLQTKIRESDSVDHLLSLNGDVIALIQNFVRLINEERNQITDFMADIGNGLLEVEHHFIASLTRTSQADQSNTTFHSDLEGQMDEISQSAKLSKSLTEFKGLVSSKLEAIRAAIERKRQEDMTRQEEAGREVQVLQQNLQSLKSEIKEMQEKSKALEEESLMDTLTEIPNRRAHDRRFSEEFQRFQRYNQCFSLLLFDVDHFKNVNDTYGHRAGDKCLKEIIKRIKPTLREADFIARYGGEEFVIILPGIEGDKASSVAERLCRIIEKTRFLYQSQEIPLTISIGVTQARASDASMSTLFNRVDKAMYEAKSSGRNRVVLQ